MKLVKIDRGWINPFAVSAVMYSDKVDYQTRVFLVGDDIPIDSYLPLDEVVAIINGGLE